MSEITIATANIYWFGLVQASALSKNLNIEFFHTSSDDLRLASLVSSIEAALLCFQEIVDITRFESVIKTSNAAFRLRDVSGHAVSSHPISTPLDTRQRVVLVWNEHELSLVSWQRIPIWTRAPLLAKFEHRLSTRRFHVIGVHAKSSAPEADDHAGKIKRRELAQLAEWVSSESAAGRLSDALILGDLNSKIGGEDASCLQQGSLVDWHWREATGLKDSHWTTTTDRTVIDHILVAPNLADRVTRWPSIVYFDRDSSVMDASPDQASIPEIMKDLTDHRPVRITLDLGS